MGYYTEFVIKKDNYYYYTCDRDGFENYVDENIQKLFNDYVLYKSYITDLLKFLNIDRTDEKSKWPQWKKINLNLNLAGDNVYFISLDNMYVNRFDICDGPDIEFITDINLNDLKKSEKFTEFLNRKFHLNAIWEKYKVSKDLALWFQCTYM